MFKDNERTADLLLLLTLFKSVSLYSVWNNLFILGKNTCRPIHVDVPQPLINYLWVFLFQKIDAECVKWASRAGTSLYAKAFIVNVNKMPETLFSTIPQTVKVNPKTVITWNNSMRSTDSLNLVPNHIMTSLSESLCLIIEQHINIVNTGTLQSFLFIFTQTNINSLHAG